MIALWKRLEQWDRKLQEQPSELPAAAGLLALGRAVICLSEGWQMTPEEEKALARYEQAGGDIDQAVRRLRSRPNSHQQLTAAA